MNMEKDDPKTAADITGVVEWRRGMEECCHLQEK